MAWPVCFKCRRFKGLNTDGTVECEIYSKTEPKLLCVFFEPKSSVKNLSKKGG